MKWVMSSHSKFWEFLLLSFQNLCITLTLAKSTNQEEQGTCRGGENLLEFRNKFPNFRNSIKISMKFYRFKLALARLKLAGNYGTRYIFLIFLEPRTD
jgi:hypothetical protein